MRLGGYILLETVIATGLLILGLSVLGAQIQSADQAAHQMELRIRALMLAETQLAHLDTGLIEIDSVDEEQEEEFGPRFKDFGWRLTTEETATEELFRLTLEILYQPREDVDEEFEFDEAEVLYTFYAFRVKPKPLDFGADFGMTEDELEELAGKLEEVGISGLDPSQFDPTIFARLDSEELLEVLPLLASAFNLDLSSIMSSLPPEVVEALGEEGLLEGLLGSEASPGGGGEGP